MTMASRGSKRRCRAGEQIPVGLVHHHDVAADLLVPGENHLLGKLGIGHHALFHLRSSQQASWLGPGGRHSKRGLGVPKNRGTSTSIP